MIELINLILDTSKSIIHKIRWVLLALLLVALSDLVSPFPSLIFTHDKYESIEIMQRLKKDTSLSFEAKQRINEEINDMVQRNSFRDYFQLFLSQNLTALSTISHIITTKNIPNANSIFLQFLSFLVFIGSCFVYSGAMYMLDNAGLKYRFKNEPNSPLFIALKKTYKHSYIKVLWGAPLLVYIILLIYPSGIKNAAYAVIYIQAAYFLGWFGQDIFPRKNK